VTERKNKKEFLGRNPQVQSACRILRKKAGTWKNLEKIKKID